MIYTAQIS